MHFKFSGEEILMFVDIQKAVYKYTRIMLMMEEKKISKK